MCKWGTVGTVTIGEKIVDIDRCIVPMVTALNGAGIRTVASCCGHGHRPGSIALADGRELIIAPDFDTARTVDRAFKTGIHGYPVGTIGFAVVAFSPDENSSHGGEWRVHDGKILRVEDKAHLRVQSLDRIDGDSFAVAAVALLPDGPREQEADS